MMQHKWSHDLDDLDGGGLTETGVGDDVVPVVTLLSVLRLHLPVPAGSQPVRKLLRGLERLEGLEKQQQHTTP